MTHPDEPTSDGYSLVMPFVACASKGGSYDDNAYAAGYEAGQLDALLSSNNPNISHSLHVVIHSGNRQQADLIAMRHGYTTTVETPVDPALSDWLHATFTKNSAQVQP